MGNYVLVYHGGGAGSTPEDVDRTMKAWMAWFAELGDALVDGGNPTVRTKLVSPDGSVTDDPNGPTGYSVIQADSIDAAVELAKGCPGLADGTSVQVAETVRM
ncbi:MAG: hypothetical protein H0T59_10955 [Chloroflexi bacterium]|nr:hypothetical protein [Chloroflexota bacterium]